MRYKIICFCIIISFLQGFCRINAQDYIYSVTVGTSWARQEFPAQERAQRKALQNNHLTIEGAPNFTKTFLDYEKDFKNYNTYNDSIFFHLSHEEWISMFKRRALHYSELYQKNTTKMAQVKEYFSGNNVPEAAYDSLYYWTRHLFFRNTNDFFMYEQMMDILLPHYEETQDIEHLVFCYLCSGMYNFQCSRMGDKDSEMRSELFFHKIMNLTDRFSTFKDPLNRYYLISAFINLSILHAQSGNVSLYESHELTKGMQKLYALPDNQEILRKDSLLNEYAKWSIDIFRYRGILSYISHGHENIALRDQLYNEYCNVRKELGVASASMKNRYYGKLEYDDMLIEAYMGHISWDDAFTVVEKMLREDSDFTNKAGVPTIKINYLYNVFETFTTILEHTSFSEKKKGRITKALLSEILDMISRYEHSRYPFEKGEILANIACEPTVVKYLSQEEKQDLIFRLIVVEQPTTYVHVSMVADLARVLAEGLIEKNPEFFVGMSGFNTTVDVIRNRKPLLDFIYQSAIFHDLGKISMPSVVNNCFRRLSDHEMDIIKLHPEKSRKFFAIDPYLAQFQDIALGHHKWFDGEGYPASFKNRKSPYFPIISIVTICDCMDAATENIGRNYHTPKSFEEVMKEFNASSGEQYHPILIDFINKNPETYRKLKHIVSDGRYDNYYKLYMRYMDQKN